jgi:hypothetical protein
MRYLEKIQANVHDAGQMEGLYREAVSARQEQEFVEDLEQSYNQAGDNPLLAAWHFRLQELTRATKAAPAGIQWWLALLIGFALGLVYFLLTDERLMNSSITAGWFPIWIGPIAALALIGFLALAGHKRWQWPVIVGGSLVVLSAYVTLFTVPMARVLSSTGNSNIASQYLVLGALHCIGAAILAVLWVATGRRIEPVGRFAVLIKAIEMIVTAGLLSALGGMVAILAVGLFGALGIQFNNQIYFRLAAGVAGGFIPVLATAIIYDPRLQPHLQDFTRGFSKVVSILLRLLLPIALVGLVVYIAVIPFYFWQPFNSRDVLIIYNVFLFAVLGMIVGATPIRQEGLPEKQQKLLRLGLICVAGLATLISLYALSAIIYRTVLSGFTPNRLTVLGWNIINIGVLIMLLLRQIKAGSERWLDALHRTFSDGLIVYSIWMAALLIILPLIFRS